MYTDMLLNIYFRKRKILLSRKISFKVELQYDLICIFQKWNRIPLAKQNYGFSTGTYICL